MQHTQISHGKWQFAKKNRDPAVGPILEEGTHLCQGVCCNNLWFMIFLKSYNEIQEIERLHTTVRDGDHLRCVHLYSVPQLRRFALAFIHSHSGATGVFAMLLWKFVAEATSCLQKTLQTT